MLDDEEIDTTKPLVIYDQVETWKKMTITNFTAKELLVPIFVDGKQVYHSPTVKEIAEYSKQDLDTFWKEYKRFKSPHIYKVDLSDKLYDLKKALISGKGKITE